eukprot:5355975-Pyramimonas_sp.AAC.1
MPTQRGGTSGGVFQCVPFSLGLSEVERIPSIIAGGRARVLNSTGLAPQGFLLISVCLYHSEGLSQRSWTILAGA